MYNIKTFYIYLRVIFVYVKLILFLVNDNVDCCITDYVKRKKCHLNRTVDCYNKCICDHAKIRCPAHTGKDGYDQSCTCDRDSIAAQMERNATVIRFAGVMSIPDAVAIKVTANICITVVPFMLMVIPVGSTKLVIS